MVTHFFTLFALTKELDKALHNSQIHEIFTQQKDGLYITVSTDEKEYTLSVSVDPAANHLLLRDAVSRARKNSVDLFAPVSGSRIDHIAMLDFDRTVTITFIGAPYRLLIQLYNTVKSNIFLLDGGGTIVEAFKQGKEFEGTAFPQHQQRFNPSMLSDAELFKSVLIKEDVSILNALKKHLPIFGAVYVREALYRAGAEEVSSAKTLDDMTMEKLFSAVQSIYRERESPSPSIVYRNDQPDVLAVVPLNHLSILRIQPCETVNQAVKMFMTQERKQQRIDDEKKELLVKLKPVVERNRKTIETLERQMTETSRAEQYERTGSIVMGNLSMITKGMSTAELPDIISGSGTVIVTLDPKLSPVKNAERYFDKAKKAKIASRETETRLKEAREEGLLLEKMLAQLEKTDTPEEVKEFTALYTAELTAMHILKPAKGAELPPFRLFTVAGGFEVWVGKSSANNDLLTMKYAKPNDLWFHARGSSGSHTVLKVRDPNHPPGKEAIYQAASIAAYYSKMRNAGNVPVAYCERKYVRKSKGLAEGAVFLEREKVILVTPRLP